LLSDFADLLNGRVYTKLQTVYILPQKEGSGYFAISSKSSAGNILQFELHPPLPIYNVEI